MSKWIYMCQHKNLSSYEIYYNIGYNIRLGKYDEYYE